MRSLLRSARPYPATLSLRPNVRVVVCYLPGGVGALVVLLLEYRDSEVRFHAVQSLLFSAAVAAALVTLTAVSWAPMLSLLAYAATVFVWMVALAVWASLMVSACQSKRVRLPVIGRLAEFAADPR